MRELYSTLTKNLKETLSLLILEMILLYRYFRG